MEMNIPSELGMQMLQYASTPGEYISIQNRMRISDEAIKDAIYDAAISGLENLTPIEQLYAIRNRCDRYIVINGMLDDEIIYLGDLDPRVLRFAGSKEDTLKHLAGGIREDLLGYTKEELQEMAYGYYRKRWNPISATNIPPDGRINHTYGIILFQDILEENEYQGGSTLDLSILPSSSSIQVIVKLP